MSRPRSTAWHDSQAGHPGDRRIDKSRYPLGQRRAAAVWVWVEYDDNGNISAFVCNDSGTDDGQGIRYGADEFLDAWGLREYSYISVHPDN
jgi:hypothetical protein